MAGRSVAPFILLVLSWAGLLYRCTRSGVRTHTDAFPTRRIHALRSSLAQRSSLGEEEIDDRRYGSSGGRQGVGDVQLRKCSFSGLRGPCRPAGRATECAGMYERCNVNHSSSLSVLFFTLVHRRWIDYIRLG